VLAVLLILVFPGFMKKLRHLTDSYRFPGFYPAQAVTGVFGDPKARVIKLTRRQKKRRAGFVAGCTEASMTAKSAVCETSRAVTAGFTWRWKSGGSTARAAKW
jgi:hypothetical protein